MTKARISSIVIALVLCEFPSIPSSSQIGLRGEEAVDSQRRATAMAGTPRIDGDIEAIWDRAVALDVNQPVLPLTSILPDRAAHARVRLLWDASHLYVLWEVSDTKRNAANGNPWEQDSVELFLDENKAGTSNYQPDDGQYRVNLKGDDTGDASFQSSQVESVAKELADGYRIEQSVTWRSIAPRPGTEVGADFQVNDDPGTGTRRAVMKWNDVNDRSWNSTAGHGTITLVGRAAAATLLATDAPPTPLQDTRTSRERGSTPSPDDAEIPEASCLPAWVTDAVFYQIFPERFRNGDPNNDPNRESLEFPGTVPDTWRISPWTGDWYARDVWERAGGDSFYENGVFNRRYGGDLQGVIDKLEYLKDLGINAIYFNPVFYARSLHKYDGAAMHHIDPYFGPDPAGDLKLMASESSDPQTWHWTAADKLFLKLLQEAHARGIRVIIDGVFNHAGQTFFAFEHLRKHQQASPYREWYTVTSWDDPDTNDNEFRYASWWGVDTLPEFANTKDGADLHPGPTAYLHDITRRWLDPNGDGQGGDGVDGWRLDVANDVPDRFWRKWHRLVRSIHPQAYTVAEIWDDSAAYLQRCGFSASMNYHAFAFPAKGYLIDGRLPPVEFSALLQQRLGTFSTARQRVMLNLYDSHDTERLASMIVNGGRRPYLQPQRFDYDISERGSARHDRDYDVSGPSERHQQIQKLAVLFQMTFVGTPMVYYGSEAGMWGGDDPDDRLPMVWPDLKYDPQQLDPRPGKSRPGNAVAFDAELHEFYRRAIRLRREQGALQSGSFRPLPTLPENTVFAFERAANDRRLIVVINRSEEDQTVEIPFETLGNRLGGRLETLISVGDVHPQPAESTENSANQRKWKMDLGACSGVLLRFHP